ncbi:hypothetical protein D3C73_1673200 [compost metagenome]
MGDLVEDVLNEKLFPHRADARSVWLLLGGIAGAHLQARDAKGPHFTLLNIHGL